LLGLDALSLLRSKKTEVNPSEADKC
jgi:hypothetical protein